MGHARLAKRVTVENGQERQVRTPTVIHDIEAFIRGTSEGRFGEWSVEVRIGTELGPKGDAEQSHFCAVRRNQAGNERSVPMRGILIEIVGARAISRKVICVVRQE